MEILGVFLGIMVVFIPIAIIALIITAAINKEKGNEALRYSQGVKTVFSYIVIISTLFMIIFGTIIAVSSLLDYFLPESELKITDCLDEYSYEYCSNLKVRNEKNEGMRNFAGSIAVVAVAIPLFTSYSLEVKKIKETKVEDNKAQKVELKEQKVDLDKRAKAKAEIAAKTGGSKTAVRKTKKVNEK